jgi:3-methyladenine DNA glycosylase AlkD
LKRNCTFGKITVSKQLKEIQKHLAAHATPGSVDFIRVMIPGEQRVYGVKTPVLNEIVKQYSKGSFDLVEELWNSGALEEKIIAIKITEKKGKEDPERLFRLFIRFSKQIDNWAVCDGMGMQFLRTVVKTHQEKIFALAAKFNISKDPWQRRLSLVMVEWYTRHSDMHSRIEQLVANLENDEEYYVRKAVRWIRRNFNKGK